jgi:hypothetical protein
MAAFGRCTSASQDVMRVDEPAGRWVTYRHAREAAVQMGGAGK